MRTATLIIAVVSLVDLLQPITAKACTVTSAICGFIVGAPTDFIIEASEPIDPLTVQATDLMVNGITANGFVITSGNTTITFHFDRSPTMTGDNFMYIPAGAFDCGPPIDFICMFISNNGIRPTPARPFPTPRPRPIPRP